MRMCALQCMIRNPIHVSYMIDNNMLVGGGIYIGTCHVYCTGTAHGVEEMMYVNVYDIQHLAFSSTGA